MSPEQKDYEYGWSRGHSDGRGNGERDGLPAGIALNYVGPDGNWVRPPGGIYWEQAPVRHDEISNALKDSQTAFARGYVEGYERGYKVGVLDTFNNRRIVEDIAPQWGDEEQHA